MTERRFAVRWTAAAQRDLRAIVSFIAVDSPVNARKVLARLQNKAKTLETSPARGRVVPELADFGVRSLRELVVAPYRLIYRVDGRAVWVLALLDARRDLQDALLERAIEQP